jgi:hypothetical protein
MGTNKKDDMLIIHINTGKKPLIYLHKHFPALHWNSKHQGRFQMSTTGALFLCRIKPDYEIGISCFSAKHAVLRGKNKEWLARNQDNVGDMSVRILFQWTSTIKKTDRVGLVQSGPHSVSVDELLPIKAHLNMRGRLIHHHNNYDA